MLGVRFIKMPPTTYVLQFKNGQVRREGVGLSFFYYAPTSSIVASIDICLSAGTTFSFATAIGISCR